MEKLKLGVWESFSQTIRNSKLAYLKSNNDCWNK